MEEEIILNNTGLIYLVLKRLNLYELQDDYFDIGMIGLINGVKTYNPASGFARSTYLYKCIYNEILQTLRVENAGKRIPKNIMISLDKELDCDDKLTLADTIPHDVNTEDEILKKERNERIYQEISKLSKKEQLVINNIFGFSDNEMTQEQLSKELKCSQSAISRIRKKALKKLKIRLKDTV